MLMPLLCFFFFFFVFFFLLTLIASFSITPIFSLPFSFPSCRRCRHYARDAAATPAAFCRFFSIIAAYCCADYADAVRHAIFGLRRHSLLMLSLYFHYADAAIGFSFATLQPLLTPRYYAMLSCFRRL